HVRGGRPTITNDRHGVPEFRDGLREILCTPGIFETREARLPVVGDVTEVEFDDLVGAVEVPVVGGDHDDGFAAPPQGGELEFGQGAAHPAVDAGPGKAQVVLEQVKVGEDGRAVLPEPLEVV